MKTWHQFSPNQYSKLIGAITIGLLPLFIGAQPLSPPLSPTPEVAYPGLVETFEKILSIDKQKNDLKDKAKSLMDLNKNQFDTIQDFEIDPVEMNSILLFSHPSYIKFSTKNNCFFYDSMVNNLLRHHQPNINTLRINYRNQKGETLQGKVRTMDFILYQMNKKCPESVKNLQLFKLKNLKSILANAKFPLPQGEEQCEKTHQEWLNNSQTAYYCQVHELNKQTNPTKESLKTIGSIKKLITPLQDFYLDKLCENLHQVKRFCQEILDMSYWNKILLKERSENILKSFCEANQTEAQIKSCIQKLKLDPESCRFSTSDDGLTPHFNCNDISSALNFSRFRTLKRDCPGTSDDLMLTNISRILTHQDLNHQKNEQVPCHSYSSQNAYHFYKQLENLDLWGLEACYQSPLTQKEVCKKTFISSDHNDRSSLVSLVSDILGETRGADKTTKCNMTSKKIYNPLLLNYKSGCHLVYDEEKCLIKNCDFKLVFNGREIQNIKIKDSSSLDYFPSNIKNERISFHYLFNFDLKKETVKVQNFTQLKKFMKQYSKGILHAVGCAEYLHPHHFRIQSFNQCRPIPFIISGVIESKGESLLVLNSSLESLTTPRVVSWNNIFQAVNQYHLLHPLKQWSLYGIK